MKKRRTLLAALLVCALLVVGVGYAATQADLSVSGVVQTNPTNIDVYFSEAEIIENPDNIEASACTDLATEDMDLVLRVIGLQEKDDYVTASYTIQNDSDYTVDVSYALTNNHPAEFSVDVVWASEPANNTKPAELAPGESHTFTVRVTLASTPNTTAGYNADFYIAILATGK